MSESPETVDLHFNIAVAGKARLGQEVFGVERTPYVDGLLEHGIASLIGGAAGEPDPEPRAGDGDLTASGPAADTSPPVDAPPVEPVEDAPIGSSRRKAADAALRAQQAQDGPTVVPGAVNPAGADEGAPGAG
jgi:hypothetical protein